jgi:hypothetical protein
MVPPPITRDRSPTSRNSSFATSRRSPIRFGTLVCLAALRSAASWRRRSASSARRWRSRPLACTAFPRGRQLRASALTDQHGCRLRVSVAQSSRRAIGARRRTFGPRGKDRLAVPVSQTADARNARKSADCARPLRARPADPVRSPPPGGRRADGPARRRRVAGAPPPAGRVAASRTGPQARDVAALHGVSHLAALHGVRHRPSQRELRLGQPRL